MRISLLKFSSRLTAPAYAQPIVHQSFHRAANNSRNCLTLSSHLHPARLGFAGTLIVEIIFILSARSFIARIPERK